MAKPVVLLADGKVDSLDTHLEQFKLNNETNQNELQVLLKEYGQLLDDYKILRKAYQQKGTGVAVPLITNGVSSPTQEKPRNPYVLVLIDGNGYIFNDELVKEKEEGGMRAARMLNDAVEKHLRDSIPDLRSHRVVVRIYADLTTVSKNLAKSKLVGLEKRSLAAFTAGFTRAINLFDFVDALDEEGTKFKIREMFKLAADDSACTHILYAACHDNSYLSLMVPYSGMRDKITLVQGAGFSNEYHQFNLNVTQFPTVFRWSGLPSTVPSSKSSTAVPNTPTKKNTNNKSSLRNGETHDTTPGSNGYPMNGSNQLDDRSDIPWGTKPNTSKQTGSTPCKYFQKGFCRFGNGCKFQHVPKNLQPHIAALDGIDRSNISALLPTSVVPGFLPLNKDGHRLDVYMQPPTQDEWVVYNARFRRQKPCNNWHLQRSCTTFHCPYDHSDLEPEARRALEYVLKCSPCPNKGACRASDCFYGHLCQKDDCVGQAKGCRMKADLHNVDPKLASMVPAEDEMVHNGGYNDDFGYAQGPSDWY
ncbi:hypothetical protein BDV96DRAFT_573557 [Lophiotrema nucula]|uniref:C3H1-type domain-containing protein n=1 Tax=Lophiotrema nucula TaxID=690887 RepID=A0A6A5ZBV7_9PLEO|nr:hypothetical protein BDV96DRAFT_573557 [Lophiotrema nucula]